MTSKIYYAVGTVPKSNRKNRGISISKHFFWHGTGTSTKRVGIKKSLKIPKCVVLWVYKITQTEHMKPGGGYIMVSIFV
jgi:hypothetical protein